MLRVVLFTYMAVFTAPLPTLPQLQDLISLTLNPDPSFIRKQMKQTNWPRTLRQFRIQFLSPTSHISSAHGYMCVTSGYHSGEHKQKLPSLHSTLTDNIALD